MKSVNGPLQDDTIAYSYDQLGRVQSQAINGVVEGVTYDSLGRLESATSALGPFTREYEGLTSRLHKLTYPNTQSATFAYHDNNEDRRLQTIQNLTDNGLTSLSTFDYTYDDEGQIKNWMRLFQGKVSDRWFRYNEARQLENVRDMEVLGNSSYAIDYDYDPAGNRTADHTYQPNGPIISGLRHEYTPNAVNQITTVATTVNDGPRIESSPAYDAAGNMTGDGGLLTFEWDAANRLSAVNHTDSGQRTEFAYDGLGRRVKSTEYGPGVTATIQPKNGDYSSFDTAPFTLPSGSYTLTFEGLNGTQDVVLIDSVTLNGTFVENGSFESPDVSASSGGYEYAPTGASWSFVNQAGLAANGSDITHQNPAEPDGRQVAFVQGTGRMFQTSSVTAGTYTLSFQMAQGGYNEKDQKVRVTLRPSVAGVTAKTFVWCGTRICEERDATGATVKKRFFAEGEQRVGGSDAGNYYYSRDHLGSIREVTDSNGVLKAAYDYDPYGNQVVVDGNMTIDFGYTGNYFHAPSGLNLTLYRAYNPAWG